MGIAFLERVGEFCDQVKGEEAKDVEDGSGEEPVEGDEEGEDGGGYGNANFSDIINEDHYIFYLSQIL